MNHMLIIKVDATINYGTRSKKISGTCTKMRRNEQNIGLHIIKG